MSYIDIDNCRSHGDPTGVMVIDVGVIVIVEEVMVMDVGVIVICHRGRGDF